MGIKKLFTFLNNNNLYKIYPYLNDLINELGIDKKKLLVGVDGNLFCHKYTHSYDNMLIGFFNQIVKFLSNKIIPLYIFDGGTLLEKENTNIVRYHKKILSKHRLEQIESLIERNDELSDDVELLVLKKKLEKNSFKVNNNIKFVLELFDLLNIPYIFSHGEGEYLAVLLNKCGIIDFFLTDDTDPIPAGINKIIKFYNNSVFYLEVSETLKKLDLTKEQFCDFCILLGTDYATFNHGLKPNEIYELILKHKSIENICENNKLCCIHPESFELINRLRNIYKYSDVVEREMFIGSNITNNNLEPTNSNISINTNINTHTNINPIIDLKNFSYYSNIMLEFWDEYIEQLSLVDLIDNSTLLSESELSTKLKNGNKFKFLVCSFVSKSKFNIKNIIKFIKNNIKDITDEEISNMIMSFDFLNTFGV